MNVVEQIIDELSDSEKSLATPFLKTKVLASRIGNEELLEWVSHELSGYSIENTPPYRIGRPVVTCDLTDGYNVNYNSALPMTLIDAKIASELTKHRFNDTIQTLEDVVKSHPSGGMVKRMGEDLASILTKQIQDKGAELYITNLTVTTSSKQIVEVLSKIRSLLLDFMLKLEKTIPNLNEIMKDERKVKEANEAVSHIYNTTINTHGDGNTITTGNSNSIYVKVKVEKNNVEQLKDALRENLVPEEDISEIVEIVQDESATSDGLFGMRVNGWISKMINRALDGSWQISAGAAGGVIVELIKKYYGL